MHYIMRDIVTELRKIMVKWVLCIHNCIISSDNEQFSSLLWLRGKNCYKINFALLCDNSNIVIVITKKKCCIISRDHIGAKVVYVIWLLMSIGWCCYFRRCLWIWQLIQPRLWDKHCSTKHGSIQQWPKLWGMLRDAMWQRPQMVRPRQHHCNRHQFLPPKPRPVQRQWWLVQSSSSTLRLGRACFLANCSVPSWNCPCLL